MLVSHSFILSFMRLFVKCTQFSLIYVGIIVLDGLVRIQIEVILIEISKLWWSETNVLRDLFQYQVNPYRVIPKWQLILSTPLRVLK